MFFLTSVTPTNSTGPSSAMTEDTTTASYWLNWRFFLCAIWVLTLMVVSAILIWKFEGSEKANAGRGVNWPERVGSLYKDETWRTSFKFVHPVLLLAYRFTAFVLLSALLIAITVRDGPGMYYFYTQWAFTLVTVYFGLACLFSLSGCCQCCNELVGYEIDSDAPDAERHTLMVVTMEESSSASEISERVLSNEEPHLCQIASVWGYVFQIMYQTSAGAVTLADCVLWFIIYPFLTPNTYKLGWMDTGMHSVNAVFLLGEAILNRLQFPFFRIAYFILLTSGYVIFQWIFHGCVLTWWPYTFLDLSSSYAPLWYFALGSLHLPCYGVFALVTWLKGFWLSRSSPDASLNTSDDRELTEHHSIAI